MRTPFLSPNNSSCMEFNLSNKDTSLFSIPLVSGLEGFHCIKIVAIVFICSERNIHIRREPQNERHFEAGYVRVVRRRTFRDYLPPEPVRSALIPPRTRWEWLDFLLVHVPIISWLLSYRPSFLVNDIVSGVTVAIMHIPQGMMV